MDDLRSVVTELLAMQYGQTRGAKRLLAEDLGVAPAVISRLLQGQKPPLELCLKLARLSGVPATAVLQRAGYGALAVLLEDLYGSPRKFRPAVLTPNERQFLKAMRLIEPQGRKALHTIVHAMSRGHARSTRTKSSPTPISRLSHSSKKS